MLHTEARGKRPLELLTGCCIPRQETKNSWVGLLVQLYLKFCIKVGWSQVVLAESMRVVNPKLFWVWISLKGSSNNVKGYHRLGGTFLSMWFCEETNKSCGTLLCFLVIVFFKIQSCCLFVRSVSYDACLNLWLHYSKNKFGIEKHSENHCIYM